jgi:hypothetical protein
LPTQLHRAESHASIVTAMLQVIAFNATWPRVSAQPVYVHIDTFESSSSQRAGASRAGTYNSTWLPEFSAASR